MGDTEAPSVAGRRRRQQSPVAAAEATGPSDAKPPRPEARRLWILLTAAALAIGGAFAVRAYRAHKAQEEAVAEAQHALTRDTYGGYRDVDRALRDFVSPHTKDVQLVAMRSYALAQLAARYGDDQAAVDSELLNAPIERRLEEGELSEAPPRFFAARALLLVATGEPGSALLALSGAPQDKGSAELDVVRAQILVGLEKPKDAAAQLQAALQAQPSSLEVLRAAAAEAHRSRDDARAVELAERALTRNPNHWPSVDLIAAIALAGKQPGAMSHAHDLLKAAQPALAEASPGEQCEALLSLAQLDLALGDIAEVVQILDQTAEIDDAPPACRAGLARVDQRLGRDDQALALLRLATADDDEAGEATLAFAEAARDSKAIARELAKPPPADISAAAAARLAARRDGDKLAAALAAGRTAEAQGLARKLEGWDIPQALCALARYQSAAGDGRSVARLLDRAISAAVHGPEAGDTVTWVGQQALALHDDASAAHACAEGARLAAGNYRALVCEGKALLGLRKMPEALAADERALAIDPSGSAAQQLHAKLSAP